MKKIISTSIVSIIILSSTLFLFLRNIVDENFYHSIDANELNTYLIENKVYLYFYSDSCAKCIFLKESLSKEDVAQIILGINIDEEKNERLVENYGISSTPTLLEYSKGKITKRIEHYEDILQLLLNI
ncbi:thioredoxin family protein [Enterococcus villorum]|uniref:Thioredoxin domain-containing protein n=2 Tax=Enterococcus villorum TaxID=112904 RepID=A0A511J383_9ENTE|nr:thioredoxin family protein [Enterococcus villorum]EOH88891.1 hypothetical protein UAO_01997 [Enterococcus villorum ATCC 700913]EOW76528.1 hypothetical protein I591_01833 [Enterococcus villorum ATCC 700913]GEL92149.1 hypothetical protein EVI01_14860 [Enterococcus villorum]